jgi:RNA polymerase sigma factor (sigma-70 family)
VLANERRAAARRVDKALRHAGRRPLDADDISRLEEQIDAERAATALFKAISGLAPGPRAVIELVDIDGLTVGEAATALRIPPVTARVRLHRARQQLKAIPTRPQADFEFVREAT